MLLSHWLLVQYYNRLSASLVEQVQLQRQEADIVKLERYIRQLVDDQGGIDAGTMEDIFRDLEKGALVRRTSKQVTSVGFTRLVVWKMTTPVQNLITLILSKATY